MIRVAEEDGPGDQRRERHTATVTRRRRSANATGGSRIMRASTGDDDPGGTGVRREAAWETAGMETAGGDAPGHPGAGLVPHAGLMGTWELDLVHGTAYVDEQVAAMYGR